MEVGSYPWKKDIKHDIKKNPLSLLTALPNQAKFQVMWFSKYYSDIIYHTLQEMPDIFLMAR